MQRAHTQKARGFTLIEILIVIGLIAILAGIVLVAINPARQFAQARNTQRQSDVNSILSAIGQHIADNKGVFAGGTPSCPALPTTAANIYKAAGGPSGTIDLSCLAPTYIPLLPIDPSGSATGDTLYTVAVDTSGRVTVCAPNAVETAIAGSVPYCVTR